MKIHVDIGGQQRACLNLMCCTMQGNRYGKVIAFRCDT